MSTPEQPDVERLRAALASLGDDAQWPDADAERLFSALHGEMSAEERRALVDELIRNPRAAAMWRLARELPPDDAEMAGAAGVEAPRRQAPWVWLSMAATLFLAVGTIWQIADQPREAPVYRSGDTRHIESLLHDGDRLPRSAAILRWSAIDGARYRVRVLTPDLQVLDESANLDTAMYRLSPETLAGIPPGGRLLWQVEARTTGAAPIVVSPTFSTMLE
ncbi:hypothetical protein [Luteitalea sp.]|uniref:hypothetical protein n=1 Tax=Luteitalea sp. TaxID=2004800 RepID=UPI0025C481B5|nr:hypothetical protein [Luteitalea sp.]